MFVCRMEIRKNKNERILDSNVVSCWLVTDTVVFQLFKRLLLRLMPQWMAGFWTHCGQWVIFKQKAECWWSSPASLWWADKKKYWNSGFCSPPFQPLNQEGTFQMIPVCLFVSIFWQTNPALCEPATLFDEKMKAQEGALLPPKFLPLSALFFCFIFVWLYNSTKPSSSVQ